MNAPVRVGRHRVIASEPDPAARRDRAVLSSAGAAVAARVVTALGALVSIGLAARSLSAAELGVVSVLTTLIVYFGFGDFGLGSMLMTRLPAAYARRDLAQMRRLVASTTSALLLVSAALAVAGTVSIFFAPWSTILGARSLGQAQLRWCLVAFIWVGAAGVLATVGTRILLAMQRGALIRSLNVLTTAVSVCSVAACSLTAAPMWAYVLAIGAPTTMLGLIELGWATTVLYPYLALDRSVFDFAEGLRCLRSGVGYAVLSLGWVMAYTLDSIVVSSILGAAQAAIFGVAARLFTLVGGTLQMAGQQMWPAISEALARGDVAWVRRRFRHSILVALATSATGSLVLVLTGQFLTRIWVGPRLVPSLPVLIIFGIWTIYMTTMTQYSYLLFAKDRIRPLACLGLVIAAVNLASSILLTREFGLVGPVAGNLVAAVLVQVLPTVIMSRRLARELGLVGASDRGSTVSVGADGLRSS